jgi:HD superfamily phosphodiesterase
MEFAVSEYVRLKCEKQQRDFSHDYTHALKVRDLSLIIFETLLQDNLMIKESLVPTLDNDTSRIIVTLAALCHDVPDGKYISEQQMEDEVHQLFHVLYQSGVKKDIANIIVDIVLNVSWSKEVKGKKKHLGEYEILRDIVSDADKIEALGIIGFKRCYHYQCKLMNIEEPKNPLTAPPTDYDNLEVRKKVLEHWSEKLCKLYEFYIKTRPGKELGLKEHIILSQMLNK